MKDFDDLLNSAQFTVHFHNEQPFISVLDAKGSMPQEVVQAYLKKRKFLEFYTAPILSDTFRKAQKAFEQAVANERKTQVPDVELFRFPLAIVNAAWNSVSVPEAGEFVPDDPNEGHSHEALLLHVLKPNFDGTVFAPPMIKDGDKTRELCDVFATGRNAFLFEAKAFSVFDKSADQSADRKAKTVMKHFEKALGQLQGAVKRLESGIEILGAGSPDTSVAGIQFQTLHGIILVSNTSFELPWLDIGKQLAEAQSPPRVYYHFIQLAELQRMVAFAKGLSDELNLMFIRRGDIIASSKDARIQTDYMPEVSSVMQMPPVAGDCLGLRFVWVGENAADWLGPFFPLVYQQLLHRAFSGRLEFYHKIALANGQPAMGLGLAAQSSTEPLGRDWWAEFHRDLFRSLSQSGLPQAAPNSERIQPLREITSKFPDVLLSVEFQDGVIVTKNAGKSE